MGKVKMSQLPVVASKNGLKVLVVDANNKNKVFDITNLLLSSEFQQALSEHNTSATAHEDLRELVEGRYNALTFLDEAQLVSWINGTYTRDDEVLVGDLVKGQNIYLMSEDEPDYWVSSLPVVGSTIETMSGLTELPTVKTAVDGKVDGPASSTDNAIARFDGVTGKLVQNSGAYIDDSGNVVISGNATINGTLTAINSETLQVKDKNIEIAKVDTPTDDTADGGGITLLGATNKTITWVKSKLSWVFNQAVEISGNLNVIGNIAVSGTVDGRDVSSDGLKLDTTVVGPASSVDNSVPVYNGTTGKVLKSGSGVSAVGGNLTATNDSASATKTIANKVRMEYDSATNTLKFNFL